jgi:transposase-like protein
MRYPASEKLEIIRIVEQSHLPVRHTLNKLGILPGSFYRWYDRYQTGGVDALADKPSKPSRIWNRIPDDVRALLIDMALDQPELSPRELAARFTDTRNYFVSEASVYRLLKARNLITSPAFIVIKASDAFKDKTTAINQFGRPTSPISRSSAGVGSISRPSLTTSRAISSPGSCAPR